MTDKENNKYVAVNSPPPNIKIIDTTHNIFWNNFPWINNFKYSTKTIIKPIRAAISISSKVNKSDTNISDTVDFADMSKKEQLEMISNLEEQMREAAKKLDFEEAATLRDTVMELKAQIS